MNGLQEIIKSGIAPGVRCGSPAVDPNSVYAKVPKAFKEIERGERRSKRGMDARDISKAFGMTTDFIKATWSKSNPRAFGCVLALFALAYGASASDITTGESFVDGQTVHASDLNAMVNNATINPTFVSGKPIQTVPTAADYFLFYSPASGILERETLQAILSSPLPYTQPFYTVYTNLPSNVSNNVFFPMYDPTNKVMAQISLPYLAPLLSQFVDVSSLDFSNTLTAYSPLPDPQNTNNQVQFMIWGTNGVPYSLTYSNLLQGVIPVLGTNYLVGYTYNDSFAPWANYGYAYPTNTGLTNVWGTYTNIFPITNLFFMNNTYTTTNPVPTLLPADTIPINSGAQHTNTTATLTSIYQFVTNQNPSALPAYTQARVQFGGIPVTLSISNTANTAQGLIQVTTNALLLSSQIYCVDVITNGTQVLWTGIAPNTPYYFIPTATNTMWGHVYSNYTDASLLQNNIPIANAGSGTLSQMLYLTNRTSFNADAIQVTTAGSVNPEIYDVCFRTNAANANYYVTGTSVPTGSSGYPTTVQIYTQGTILTNKVRVQASAQAYNGTETAPQLIQILVNPQ
jgi:hypothetical protein